ncbi:hypothetical protein VNO77_27406 [Canavalia gladiata]|uniref:Uncharacterized protein n=1 Tax=Canavalia gladiata TaxID=3824 RepID=A0AAN9KXT2_CANGL
MSLGGHLALTHHHWFVLTVSVAQVDSKKGIEYARNWIVLDKPMANSKSATSLSTGALATLLIFNNEKGFSQRGIDAVLDGQQKAIGIVVT